MLGQGGYLLNAKGERFMERYDPVRMERAPKTVVGIAIAKEYLAGRGPVFQDLRHLNSKAHQTIRDGVPIYVKTVEKAGLDLTKDMVRYNGSMMPCMGAGGVRINQERATTITGLYAAGSSADHAEDGAENVVGNGMESAVAGRIAGRYAAQYALEAEPPVLIENQVQLLAEDMVKPLKRDKGIAASEITEDVGKIWETIEAIRSEKALKEAINRAKEVESEKMPNLGAKDYHGLAGTLGAINKVLFVELFCKFALMRTESRGGHYRTDYPEPDDKNWLRWVICQQTNRGVEVWSEPIPFNKYPLRPPSQEK
jgi:succinate dehydrogenase/fumarate reductase flavoprotein subunit